jgi:hypothetical protein
MKIARIYERVSTSKQELTRHADIKKRPLPVVFMSPVFTGKKHRVPGLTDLSFSA